MTDFIIFISYLPAPTADPPIIYPLRRLVIPSAKFLNTKH